MQHQRRTRRRSRRLFAIPKSPNPQIPEPLNPHVQIPPLLAVSSHAIHRPGVDHQRHAGGGRDDRGQQRDVGFHQRDAEPHPRHHFRRGVRGPQPGRHARRRLAQGADLTNCRRQDRGHDGHGGGAGDAQLSIRRALDHPAGETDRHRRGHAGERQRLQHLLAASRQPPGRFGRVVQAPPGRLRRPQPPGRQRSARAHADALRRLAAPPRGGRCRP